jgi:glycosyltransferase involved in cell wall biosynthesis
VLRVHLLYEHGGDYRPHACSYIRMLLPLSHPVNSSALRLSWGAHYEPADILIVERLWKPAHPWSIDSLVDRQRSSGGCFVYAIDDNLLDLSPGRLGGLWTPATEDLMTIQRFAQEADGIIVATPLLGERLVELNERIYVVSNALDERLYKRRSPATPAPATERKILGYMGTVTHDADLAIVSRALRKVLERHRDGLEFQLIGGCSNPDFLKSLEGLPVRVLDPQENARYPKFVEWMTQHVHWDLAIAPLEDSPFTRCKSDMKFLDYSALGIAGVYSRVPAYETSVRHLESGYLVENDWMAWESAIEEVLADDSLRLKLSRNAEEYVRSNRMLEQRAHCWRDVVDSIVGAARANGRATADVRTSPTEPESSLL